MLSLTDISQVLGGRKLLGKKVESTMELIELIRQGLSTKSLFYLQKATGLGDVEYAVSLGVSSKTLGRYRKEPKQHLDVHVSDRLYRIARIFKLAEEVMESKDAALQWLHDPQLALGELPPLELITTEAGAKEVEELLYRIEYGLYS